MKQKTSMWACGSGKNLNTKKLHVTILSNDILKMITNKSKMTFTNEQDAFATIEDFLLVEPKEFLKLLKDISGTSFD